METLGKKYGVSDDNGNFWNVSLGQGQEGKAMESLDKAFTSGGWVILNVSAGFPFNSCDCADFLWTSVHADGMGFSWYLTEHSLDGGMAG